MADDTIYALSSGRPPAAIAVVRISGPGAAAAGQAVARSLPPPRRAARRRLYDKNGALLDDALVIFFDGPATATGEDLVELHLHGGRAVVAAVEQALAAMPALRLAEPGEFTRRALANGRIDLAQAEGLADLLEAETEAARRAALALLKRRRIVLENGVLVVAATFYTRKTPVAALDLANARIANLDEHTEFRPGLKINGYALPGFQAGHFRLRNRAKAFCLLTRQQRVLILPQRDRAYLLLSPEHPQALLDALRQAQTQTQTQG